MCRDKFRRRCPTSLSYSQTRKPRRDSPGTWGFQSAKYTRSITCIYAQDLGRSEFLRDLDASFSLSVQRSKPADDGAELSSLPKDAVEGTGAEADTIDSGIDVAIVLNILKPFGDLRSFKFSRQEVNQDLVSKATF